jgi:MoaA/NifB/PqqE/SkfB family radical SAM enzyme
MEQNNYCPLIFHSIYVERVSNGKHYISPCCLAKKSGATADSIDFANNQYLNSIREENKNNKRPDACQVCWTLEDVGGESNRMVSIDSYKKLSIPLDHTTLLYNLDYNVLPICNAKCVICSPRYSSTWAAAKGLSLKPIVANNYNHLDGLNFNNIKIIYFNGGEPLLTDEHLNVLKKINNINSVEISYNTNGSCYPSEEVLNIWSQAKSVTIAFSVDGIKDRFETTRVPLKWNTVSANIEKMNLLPNIDIQCAYTIGRHNVYDLEDTINWFGQLPNFDVFTQFHVHYVNIQHPLSLKKSSDDQKQKYKQELLKFNKFHWYSAISNIL